MKRSKMFDDKVAARRGDDDASPDAPSPRTTIVGGRPPEDGAALPPVPTGIQQLLRLAAVDSAFARELVERRESMADVADVALTPNEALVLHAAPGPQLEQMIAAVPPPDPNRRTFLRQTASTAVLLLGGAALASAEGCRSASKTSSAGAAPDEPPPKQETPPVEQPPQRPEHPETPVAGGAAPDEPPERVKHREMQETGGAAPDEPPPG